MSSPIYINGRFLTQVPSGMQRYARCLIQAWDRLREKADTREPATILVPAGPRSDLQLKSIAVRQVGWLHGHYWEQTQLMAASADGILISLTSAGPVLHRRHIVAMHDAGVFAAPANFGLAYRTLHRVLRPQLARSAHRLITVSEFSRGELARFCGVPPEKFEVIPNSAAHMLEAASDRRILSRAGLTPGRYFLAVGNRSPNKNLVAAARGFAHAGLPNHRLVVIGGAAADVFGRDASVAGDRVDVLGRVEDDALKALYEHATALVFPSLYEGFGVPPLEAMTLGCPVVSSNTSVLPEVLGDAAILVDPYDYADLGRAMRALATDPGLRNRLARAGLERAACYSWDASAELLDELITSSNPDPN